MDRIMKIFRKAVKTAKEKQLTNSEIVQRIHREFNTYGDDMVEQANEILSKSIDKDKQNKANRLLAIGFNGTEVVKENNQSKAEKYKAKSDSETVMYFKQNYPMYKFINESGVKSICEKYGLVFASSEKYKGDIPEKNLKEIENFKISDEDKIFERRSNLFFSNIEYISYRESKTQDIYSFYSKPEECKFEIVAPKSDFNMSGMERVGYKLTEKIEDPVVLKRVDGGYLIVTAWGDEASDELVINEIMN